MVSCWPSTADAATAAVLMPSRWDAFSASVIFFSDEPAIASTLAGLSPAGGSAKPSAAHPPSARPSAMSASTDLRMADFPFLLLRRNQRRHDKQIDQNRG